MSGRRNKVNLPTDLVLLALHASMDTYGSDQAERLACNGMYRTNLKETLAAIDLEPFNIERPLFGDYSEFMNALEMFEELDAITSLRRGKRIRVTDTGRKMAEPLVDVLTEEQETTLEEVGITFKTWHRP